MAARSTPRVLRANSTALRRTLSMVWAEGSEKISEVSFARPPANVRFQ
jgi:hypothetical protein